MFTVEHVVKMTTVGFFICSLNVKMHVNVNNPERE
jgi:hypothetical protein